MARFIYRYGAMNCGKTTQLLQNAHQYTEIGDKVLILKPAKDKKGDTKIVSRIGASQEVDYLISPRDNIIRLITEGDNVLTSCIMVDEAQFLTPTQVEQLRIIVSKFDIDVFAYGLRTDFKTKAFPGSIRLMELCDKMEEINQSLCECGEPAIFNARFVNGKMVTEGAQVAIDGFDSVTYKPMCAKCYYLKKAVTEEKPLMRSKKKHNDLH